MPAAAVIPAPLAYTIIVAVKRLVVGLNNLQNYYRIRIVFLNLLLLRAQYCLYIVYVSHYALTN